MFISLKKLESISLLMGSRQGYPASPAQLSIADFICRPEYEHPA
jgi:hypothetical protein